MEGVTALNNTTSKKGRVPRPTRERKKTAKEVEPCSSRGRKNSNKVQSCEATVLTNSKLNERLASPSKSVKEKRPVKKDKRKSNERTKDLNKLQACKNAVITTEKEDNERTVSSKLQPTVDEPIQDKQSKYLASMIPRPSEENKSFITTECNQTKLNQMGINNENENSQYEAVSVISGGVSKLNLNFKLIDQKMRERRRVASFKSNKQVHAPLPSFEDLSEANRFMYMRQVFDGFVFNYNMLSYRGLYKIDSSLWNPNENIENVYGDEATHDFNELFLDSDFIKQFNKYETAINKLVKGHVSAAQKLLLELVKNCIQPAYYALSVVVFNQISKKYDIYNGKDIPFEKDDIHNIETAIKLLKRASQMSPANDFLLGMLKRCNIGKSDNLKEEILPDSLINVVNIAKSLGLLKLESSVLSAIAFRELRKDECGLGMRKKLEILEKMSNYSLYEIAQDILSEKQFSSDLINSLFAAMSENFSEGLYGYAFALIQDKIRGNFQDNMKKAKTLLYRAVSLGHEGAKLLLGILPFRLKTWSKLTNHEVKRCISELEDYICNSDDSCFMNKEIVDKAAFYLALEYSKQDSNFVQCKPEWAKQLLISRGLPNRLEDLRKKSQILVEDSIVSSTSNINFAPKFTSTGIRRYNSTSGVETMQSDDLPIPSSSSTTTQNGIVFGSTEHSNLQDREQKNRREKSVSRFESSGWRRV